MAEDEALEQLLFDVGRRARAADTNPGPAFARPESTSDSEVLIADLDSAGISWVARGWICFTASRKGVPATRRRVAAVHPRCCSVPLGWPGWTASTITRRRGLVPRPFRSGVRRPPAVGSSTK